MVSNTNSMDKEGKNGINTSDTFESTSKRCACERVYFLFFISKFESIANFIKCISKFLRYEIETCSCRNAQTFITIFEWHGNRCDSNMQLHLACSGFKRANFILIVAILKYDSICCCCCFFFLILALSVCYYFIDGMEIIVENYWLHHIFLSKWITSQRKWKMKVIVTS